MGILCRKTELVACKLSVQQWFKVEFEVLKIDQKSQSQVRGGGIGKTLNLKDYALLNNETW